MIKNQIMEKLFDTTHFVLMKITFTWYMNYRHEIEEQFLNEKISGCFFRK